MSGRLLLDTGVFISYFGRPENSFRTEKARVLIRHINQIQGEILYSQRTLYELKERDWASREEFINQCTLASYHFGNETIEKIEGTWENIGSLFNNDADGEFQLSEELNLYLIKERDTRDRGILLDAIKNECDYFIHENPRDFNRVPKEMKRKFKIIVINLLALELQGIESAIK